MPGSGIDILTISETWLTPDYEDKLVGIPGYTLTRLDRQMHGANRQLKKGGGLAVYCKDRIQVDGDRFIDFNTSDSNLEAQWVVVSRQNTKPILIGNIYRPPTGSISVALDGISNCLAQLKNKDNYKILILGDFNANTRAKVKAPAKAIRNFETEINLRQVIKGVTSY